MNYFNEVLVKAGKLFLIMSIICGLIYTAVVTGIAQLVFPEKANGSIIEVDGVAYGCELLGQQYTDEAHMWGRIMNIDTSTFVDEEGNALMYAGPSNLSPASDDMKALIEERVAKLQAENPDKKDAKIPVDLVTCSGSGLDPHISVAAAEYQVERLAKANNMSVEEIQKLIEQSSDGKFLGIFGEKTVNVLEFNLRLDGILTQS